MLLLDTFGGPDRIMESEDARRRCQEGGSMLCLGIPEGTEMRCDMTSWRAGPMFKGIKMIPPGLHLISVRHNQKEDR